MADTDLLAGRQVIPPGDWLALVARRYTPDPLLLALAAVGVAWLVWRRAWVWLGFLAVTGVGVLALLGLEAWRGTYISWRYLDPADLAVRLAAALSAACKAAGLRFEDRPLHPHLTLARFSTPAPVPQEALDLVAGAAADGQPWEARELACYRSTLGGPRGARYRVLREFPLAG